MAKKKKKKSSPSVKARANHSKRKTTKKRAKSRNPGVSLASVKRLLSGKKKKGGRRKTSRNPMLFGVSSSDALANSAAVLGAVTIAKLVPPMLPASWTATDLGRFLTTAGVAVVEVFAAHMLIPRYRTMVLAGAGAQTLSVGLNPVLRKVSSTITLGRIQQQRSLRDFVPGNFPEPHNPIWQLAAAGGANSGAVGYMDRYAPAY